MHSWRVLLLPYLGEQELYSQYDFTEPWDGPNNQTLVEKMPETYATPGGSDLLKTQIVAVVGDGLAWQSCKPTTLKSFRDGPENSVHVVAANGYSVSWTSPEDLFIDVDDSAGKGESRNAQAPWSLVQGADVLMADGSVWHFSEKAACQSLVAFFTIAEGDLSERELLMPAKQD